MTLADVADKGAHTVLPLQSSEDPCLFSAARLGSIEMEAPGFVVWVQCSGSAWIRAREGKFHLREGEWLAFPGGPGAAIQVDERGLGIGIQVSREFVEAAFWPTQKTIFSGHGCTSNAQIRSIGKAWYRAAKSQTLNGGRALEPLVRSLLSSLQGLQRPYQELIARCPGQSVTRKKQIFERMQCASLSLLGSSGRVIRIPELAAQAQMSAWHFSKVFRSLYGECAQTAALQYRLREAASMLSRSDLSITEISGASGFESSCSFSRAFKAHFGLTASEYRMHTAGGRQVVQTRFALPPSHSDTRGRRDGRMQYGSKTAIDLPLKAG